MYIGEEMSEEPDFQYIPDTHQYASNLPQGHSPLDGSLLLLNESLQSGAALAQFEVGLVWIGSTYSWYFVVTYLSKKSQRQPISHL